MWRAFSTCSVRDWVGVGGGLLGRRSVRGRGRGGRGFAGRVRRRGGWVGRGGVGEGFEEGGGGEAVVPLGVLR